MTQKTMPKFESDWARYYQNRLNPKYEFHIRTRYAPFINMIGRELDNFEFVAEMGCGIGSITKQLLSYPGANEVKSFVVADINPEMLSLTKDNLAGCKQYSKLIFLQSDIRRQLATAWNTTLHHSHGVLEHFSDADIRKIIESQKLSADLIFHYVPSDKYTSKSFGDERLMSPSQWKEVCNPTEIIEFNDGYDLVLIWRR